MQPRPIKIGDRFGKLTVVGDVRREYVPTIDGYKYFHECVCDCGNKLTKRKDYLRDDSGCRYCTHGTRGKPASNRTHGMDGTRLYKIWAGMKDRCGNPRNWAYDNYGGRGITVCPEWNDASTFIQWALANGYEEHLTIDRIDNEGGYCPDNCRWATQHEQCRNKRNNIWIEAFGEKKLPGDWAKDPRCQVTGQTLIQRIRKGMNPEAAIVTATEDGYRAGGKNRANNVWIEAFGERKTATDWGRDSRCRVQVSTLTYRIRVGWEPERALSQPAKYERRN